MAQVHRTFWLVRQRYRRGGLIGALLAVCLVAAYLVPMVHGAQLDAAAATTDWLSGVGLILAAALVPPLLARVGWQFHKRRFIDDMRSVGLH
jgi:prepilin signal peptidase PulO-like enzyme (type II secretory pathway)